MANKLYKVNVEVDVYVMAAGLAEAAKIGRSHSGEELVQFGQAHASEVGSVYELPEDWEDIVPYSKDSHEVRSCRAIMKASKNKEVIVSPVEVKEELPVELPKNEDLPQLRFKI